MKRSLRRAIKESVDNLPSGICFAAENGAVVLCNRQMYRLCHVLTGRDLQLLEELRAALKDPAPGVTPVDDATHSMLFPNGEVWSFRESAITDAAGEPFTQVQALDVTALYRKRVELEKENEALMETNRRARQLYRQLDRTVREEETFAMKMRVHDALGMCMTASRRALEGGGTPGELKEAAALWRRTLTDTIARTAPEPAPASTEDALRELMESAAAIGVRIRLDGALPRESGCAYILITAMRECAVNTVRHASGSELTVRLRREGLNITARITNDGRPPRGRIAEGGGLSGLRRRVERAGGSMRVESSPEFVLTITLPREEGRL